MDLWKATDRDEEVCSSRESQINNHSLVGEMGGKEHLKLAFSLYLFLRQVSRHVVKVIKVSDWECHLEQSFSST